MVVVEGTTVEKDAASLVATIKEAHPDMPIAWFTSDPKSVHRLGTKVELVTGDAEQLEAWLAPLSPKQYYSAEFVSRVVNDLQGVLAEFNLPTRTAEPCVKSGLSRLSEINAILLFSGEGIGGHVILSASSGDLLRAHRNQFPRASFPAQDDLEDLLGEVANRAVGQLKRTLRGMGPDFRTGLPHFIRGENASFRHKAGVPAIGLVFSENTRKVLVEVCVSRLDVQGGAIPRSNEPQMVPGVINVL
jgi:CheY-specific phosphatase CheX